MVASVKRENWQDEQQFDAIRQLAQEIDRIAPLSNLYTPILFNVTNLDSSTAHECQLLRILDVCMVFGKVEINPTLMSVATELGISLPISSNLAIDAQCSGIAFNTVDQGASIVGDITNNRARLLCTPGSLANQTMFFLFMYRII